VEALDTRQSVLEPILEESRRARERAEGRGWRLALVPGSRVQEITALLPVMLETVTRLGADHPHLDLTVRISQRPELPPELYESCGEAIERHSGPLDELVAWCDSALVTSGTATLEAALLEKPFILVYRTSALTYTAYRIVRTIPFIGLPNILAGKEIVRECVQDTCRPEILAAETMAFAGSAEHYHAAVERLRGIKAMLGSQHPSDTVSDIIGSLAER
jgi:lipid-A-disaccharide synthase